MKQLDFKRILCIVAFLGLAGFSCFWTAESLFIWQPSITIYGAWLIAIVFYAVAAICFNMVIKGLDKNAVFKSGIFESRGGHLSWGILGLLVFWLMVSLPTNTHTLLYRASIKNIITTDLNRTQGYLLGFKDNNIKIKEIENLCKTKEARVESILKRMLAEIGRPGAEGIGKMFNTCVAELEVELGATFQKMPNVGSNRAQWLITLNFYQKQAYDQLQIFIDQRNKEIKELRRLMNDEALNNLIKNSKKALYDIDNMKGVSNNLISAAVNDLTNSYSYIKTYSKFINFNDNDSVRYTRDGAIPEAKEMLSVPDVWKDYLTTDKYNGYGFIWWVLIALLVDLAAFIFARKAF